MRRLTVVVSIWLLASTEVAQAPVAWAQLLPAPQDTAEPPAAAALAPRPIPPGLISAKSDETAAVLRSMAERHGPDPALEQIRSALPGILGRAEKLLGDTENRLGQQAPPRAMEELERRLLDLRAPLFLWRAKLQRQAHGLDRDLQTLTDLRGPWEATLQLADSTLAATTVAQEAVTSIRAMETQFDERRAELFTVEEQVRHALGIIQEGLEQIETARERARMQITALDVPPLWSALLHPLGSERQVAQLRAAWQDGKGQAREFVRASRNALVASGVFFLVALVGSVRLGRGLRRRTTPEPELEAAARILTRPVSAAVIASVLLVTIMIPRVPAIVSDFASILLFVPLFRVLPHNLTQRRRLLAALVAAHVLGVASENVVYLSPLQQLMLLVQGLVAFWAFLFLVRQRPATRPTATFARLQRGLQWLALILAGGAAVADIVGNVSLAAVVLRAVTLSAYLGLAFYITYHVLQGVVWAMLRHSFLRHSLLVRQHEGLLRRRTLLLLRLALVYIWCKTALQILLLWNVVATGTRRILAAQAHFGEVAFSLGDALSLIVTIWASFLLSRLLRFFLEGEIYTRLSLPRGLPNAFSTGLHYLILLCGFFLAVAATGVELSKFTIIVSAFSVGIGFGLQNVINNFVSGLILMIERPIMPGDSVQIGQTLGEVKRIGMRSSTVRTPDGAEVIVPNAHLIATEVINWTLSDRLRRIDLSVGVEYGSDPQEVLDLLVATGARHPEVLAQPEPSALFLAFGESSLDVQLRVWTANIDQWMRIKSEIALAVYGALQEAGIGIPFPQREVLLKSAPDGTAEGPAPREARERAPRET
ncbi:MAG TPA: mechanosensitive ion channel domain-containing protein [Candidatus Krumholzibacteria bacterium]|nr:mechanosensitive ion channel domain-containing protein [Candidatus Krumholzibacteria bacterium]